jgi:hypothetical protein
VIEKEEIEITFKNSPTVGIFLAEIESMER